MDTNLEQQLPHYIGERVPNCDYHHGHLPPVRGAMCRQVVRANRTHPDWSDGTGWTYKHGADLAFRAGTLYLHYFTNPVSEHTGPGQSILARSQDGVLWEDFCTAFPPYRIPACTVTDYKGNTTSFSGESYAFIHQRTGFYQAKNGRLLLLGFYGWSPQPWVNNWDNYGIGRVVRELFADDTLGPIYCAPAGRADGRKISFCTRCTPTRRTQGSSPAVRNCWPTVWPCSNGQRRTATGTS